MKVFEIIHENKDFIVVNKIYSHSFHNDSSEEGFFSQVKHRYPEIHPVHRLDKETTGLILFARHTEAKKQLNQLFKSHKIEKTYIAISNSKPKKKQGLIKGDLVSSRGGSYRLSKSLGNPSITQFFSKGINEGVRLFVLRPHTGRTHQLRVVMKSLGSPILGDKRYKGEESSRMYLHAYTLKFKLNAEDYYFAAENIVGKVFQDILLDQKHYIDNLPWPAIK